MLVVQFAMGGSPFSTAFFSSATKSLRQSGDALFCLGILPAMELGVDLVIDDPVDAQLLDNADAIQGLIVAWYPWAHRIKIIAEICHSKYPSRNGRGLFYSGGVDSSYSLATIAQRLDALVTIIGVDKGIDTKKHASILKSNLDHIASEFDLEPIIVETNIREVSDRLIGWLEYYGSVLAAVRHMLADHLEHQTIAASDFEVSKTRPVGSHPELDPLFGTKNAPIEHHGLIDRFAKIQKVAENDRLLESTKVCYKSSINCGVCPKCTYVMESLDVIGKFDRAASFPRDKLGHGTIALFHDAGRSDAMVLRKAAQEHGGKRALISRLDTAVAHYDTFQPYARMIGKDHWQRRFRRWKRQLRYGYKSLMIRFAGAHVR
jgi:hypothetical protein